MAETRQRAAPGRREAGREHGARAEQQRQRNGSMPDNPAASAAAEATRRTGHAAARATRHGTHEFARSERRLADTQAGAMEESAERYAEAIRHMTEDMTRLMLMPGQARGGLREMQDAMGDLLNGVMRSNLRLAQEVFRRASPGMAVDVQGAFLRECLDAMMDGGTTVLRAARRSADDALRPLEQRRARRDGATPQGGRDAPRVADVMTRKVRIIGPEESAQRAARMMAEQDSGILPVAEEDRLVGMLTDRDLAIRVLAEGRDPARTKVRDAMTAEVLYVFADQDLDAVAESMRENQVRRMPVLDRDKRLVGIVSLGDLAVRGGERPSIAHALAGIAHEGGRHDQSLAMRGG